MDEQRPGEGGTANTPPFPRLVDEEPTGGTHPQPPRTPDANAEDRGGETLSDFASFGNDPSAAPSDGIAPLADEPDPWDSPVPIEASSDVADHRESRHFSEPAESEVGRRSGRGLHRAFEEVADRLDDAADRLGRVAEEQLGGRGPNGRAGEVAQSAADWMEDVADYLRGADLRQMQRDLERQVREKPLPTLVAAAGAGWLLGRIMR